MDGSDFRDKDIVRYIWSWHFRVLPRKLIYKIFVSTATARSTLKGNIIEGKTRAIVAVQVQATTYDDSDLLFSLAIKNKRKICYAKLRKFMRRFVRLWGLSKLRCVKCRTLFFVVNIYRASKIIYVQYKSYRLLPSILSFHPLCIKHVSSLSHSFLNKLIADVTHTIKTDYFFQSFQPFRLTRLFSN